MPHSQMPCPDAAFPLDAAFPCDATSTPDAAFPLDARFWGHIPWRNIPPRHQSPLTPPSDAAFHAPLSRCHWRHIPWPCLPSWRYILTTNSLTPHSPPGAKWWHHILFESAFLIDKDGALGTGVVLLQQGCWCSSMATRGSTLHLHPRSSTLAIRQKSNNCCTALPRRSATLSDPNKHRRQCRLFRAGRDHIGNRRNNSRPNATPNAPCAVCRPYHFVRWCNDLRGGMLQLM